MFSNREIAAATWLVIFMGGALTLPSVRKSFRELITCFSNWKIVATAASMVAYYSLVLFLFSLCNIGFDTSR